MRRDADETELPDEPDRDAAGHGQLTSLARGARLLATPAAIVVAWLVVVTQWNSSDEQLFNWATITAAVVLAVVTVAWLVSSRFPALRRALLPFEGGLVVGAIVLAAATRGREVDMLADRIAIAFAFGVIAALLLAFMQQLVDGRRRARMWLGGVVVACIALGIAIPAALDWLEGDISDIDGSFAMSSEVVARASGQGFRLDDVSLRYGVSSLSTGYLDDAAYMDGGIYADPAVPMAVAAPVLPEPGAPGTIEPTGPAALAAPAAPGAPVADPMSAPAPTPVAMEGLPDIANDWARLLARRDGSLRLVVDTAIANGVTGRVVGSLRRGTCRTAVASTELASLTIPGSGNRPSIERTLSIELDDLRIDDQLSVIVGTAQPLAPTRCMQLLTSSGIALAQLGAPAFVAECIEPLDLPRGSEHQVRSSSFQDPTCASRFDEFARISSALLVPKSRLAEYRACHRSREVGIDVQEQALPHGARAVTYPDQVYGECFSLAANAATLGSYAASAPMLDPATGMEYTVGPTGSVGMTDALPAPASVAPAGATPVAPAPAAPTEELDGLTPEELAAKVR